MTPTSRPVRSADERTDLAWNRSGLAIIACGLIVARGLTLNGFERRDVAVGAVMLGMGMVSYLLAGWHARRRLAPGRAQQPARTADVRLSIASGQTSASSRCRRRARPETTPTGR